jgi:hypothetical protein
MMLLALLMWFQIIQGAPGTSAVWTLCDWLESEGVPVESVFEDPESNGPVPLARIVYSSTPLGSCTKE